MPVYKYLLAPGNSPHNATWIKSIENELTSVCQITQDQILTLNYRHWETHQRIIDLDYELNILKDLKLDTVITVFAKSAGIILTMLAVINNIIKAKRFIFTGFPYYFAQKMNHSPEQLLNKFAQTIAKHNVQVLFLQKPKDPAYHYDDLKKFLQKSSLQYELIKYNKPDEPIDNHHYADINYLTSLICK